MIAKCHLIPADHEKATLRSVSHYHLTISVRGEGEDVLRLDQVDQARLRRQLRQILLALEDGATE